MASRLILPAGHGSDTTRIHLWQAGRNPLANQGDGTATRGLLPGYLDLRVHTRPGNVHGKPVTTDWRPAGHGYLCHDAGHPLWNHVCEFSLGDHGQHGFCFLPVPGSGHLHHGHDFPSADLSSNSWLPSWPSFSVAASDFMSRLDSATHPRRCSGPACYYRLPRSMPSPVFLFNITWLHSWLFPRSYGFTTLAMLMPAIGEFDFAMGRSKSGQEA